MESLLKCRKFEVVRHLCEGRDGRPHAVEIIQHPGAVVILPLLDRNRCLILRQFRPALNRELWELPAGTLDVPGEDPQAAAGRELEEETGYRAGKLEYLCEFYTSPGILTELIRSYVATDLTRTAQRLEPLERIHVECMSVDEALAMMRDGRIVDAKTMVTLARWSMRGKGTP